MVYQMTSETPSYLCDRFDRLHPLAAVRLCQEVTEYHGNATGIGFQTLVERNRAWVLTRAYYIIFRRPAAFEKIMLNTWSRGNDGLLAFRDYKVTSPKGEVVMTGTSYWALIDYASRRVVRLNDVIANYETHTEQATDRTALAKLVPPTMDESDLALELQVKYSMLDHTNHVNNSEYIKWIFDCLDGQDFDMDRPFSLELNFQLESRPGENVSVFRKSTDDTFWFQIRNPRGVSVISKVTYL